VGGEEVCRHASTACHAGTRSRQDCTADGGTPVFDGPISATTSSHLGLSARWPLMYSEDSAGVRACTQVANRINRPYQGCARHRGATITPCACSSSTFFNTSGMNSNGGFHWQARPLHQYSAICDSRYFRWDIGCSSTGRYGKTTASGSCEAQIEFTNSAVALTSPGLTGTIRRQQID
jgi:hypothetical protein